MQVQYLGHFVQLLYIMFVCEAFLFHHIASILVMMLFIYLVVALKFCHFH